MIKKSQSITEYTFIVGIVSLALVAMSSYGRRGIQAVIKLSSDKLGEQKDFTGSGSPRYNRDESQAEGLTGVLIKSENAISRESIERRKASSGAVEEKKGSLISGNLQSEYKTESHIDKELE